MSRRPLFVLIGLLAVLALGFTLLWKTTQAPAATAADPSAPLAADVPAASPANAAPALESAHEESTPERKTVEKAVAKKPEGARREVLTPLEAELKHAQWVEGRVKFPDGTPADEKLVVEARGKKFSNDSLHSVEVGRDGAFRVAFSKDTRSGWLRIQARYSYLAEDVKVKLPLKPGEPASFELTPLLGGLIRGRLALPPAAATQGASLAGTHVQVWPTNFDGSGTSERLRSLYGEVGPDQGFEIGGVPGKSSLTLSVDPANFVRAQKENLKVEAGRSIDAEIALVQGVRLAGKVVDEDGAAVAGAGFTYFSQVTDGTNWSNFHDVKSAADGSFDLHGMPTAKGTLSIEKDGFVTEEQVYEGFGEGSAQEGLRIVLRRGNAIAGLVQWPDGKPVAGAQVSMRYSDEQPSAARPWLGRRDVAQKTDAEGRFRFTGLGKGKGTLRAESRPPAGADKPVEAASKGGAEVASAEPAEPNAPEAGKPDGADKKPEKQKPSAREDKRRKWTAISEDVSAGTQSVVLVLTAGYSVSGRVLDAGGAAVKEFLVRAEPVEKEREDWRPARGVQTRRFSDEAGRFTFDGLHEGAWKLSAETQDAPACTPRVVQLPGSGAPLELVLARAASISGVVVDPAGQPVLGAQVRADVKSDKGSLVAFNSRKKFSDTTDKAGKFDLSGVPAGPARLFATSEEWAAAEPLPLDLAPGQKAADLRLVLRRPGRIAGLVLDDAGHPDADRPVNLSGHDGATEWKQATTDAQGRFTIEKLAPGSYSVSTQVKPAEYQAVGDDSEKLSRLWQEQQRNATVKVEEGATAEVTLGGPPKNAVHLSGVVTSGGKPLGDASLLFYKQSSGEGEEMRQRHAATAADGTYALALDGEGKYMVSIAASGSATRSNFDLELKGTGSQKHDFELPGCTLAGRVVDREGKPQAQVWLELHADPNVRGQGGRNISGNVASDEEGRFRFEHLAPGTYEISCGGNNYRWGAVRTGRSTLGGLKVEDGRTLEGLELVLQPACRVEGNVIGSDGAPVAGATVIALDEKGRRLTGWERETTDAAGHFAFESLPPVRATFCATKGMQSSGASTWVQISEGEPSKVDLALVNATLLFVQPVDAQGNGVQADVQVLDARGLDQGSLSDWNVQPSAPLPGHRFGPLAPGKYTVVVMLKDKPDVRQEVTLSGDPTQAFSVHVE